MPHDRDILEVCNNIWNIEMKFSQKNKMGKIDVIKLEI